jgi:hypothetical protein
MLGSEGCEERRGFEGKKFVEWVLAFWKEKLGMFRIHEDIKCIYFRNVQDFTSLTLLPGSKRRKSHCGDP